MADDDRTRFGRNFGEGYAYVAVGFQLAAIILVFGGLGWVVDDSLHTRPLLAVAGFLLGTVVWCVSLNYRVMLVAEAVKRKTSKGKAEGRGATSIPCIWGRNSTR